MKRSYKVRYDVSGFKKGDVVSDADFANGVNTDALVAGHFLTVDTVEPVACPACVEYKVKRPPKFDSIEKLREHYVEKHAALVPPTEEDLADG